MKKTYKVNGQEFNSMLAIARFLGMSRVRPKDFERLGIIEADPEKEEPKKAEPKKEEPKEVVEKKAEPKKAKGKTKKEPVDIETLVLPKDDCQEFNKVVKKLTNEELIQFAKREHTNLHIEFANPAIRRMRIIMDLRYKFYSDLDIKKAKTSKSPWKKFTLSELEVIAKNNKVAYEQAKDSRITRMRIVSALKKANVQPPLRVN